jgi:hemolysin activation/secretion protein
LPVDLPLILADAPTNGVAMVAPAAQESEPIVVESHGFRYTIAGNTLLSRAVVAASVASADTPKAAVDALNAAYQRAGHFLTAIRGEVQGKTVALRVFQGRITEEDIADDLVPYFAGIENREDLDRNTIIRKSALAELYAARQDMRPKVSFSPATAVGGSKITVSEEPIEGSKRWNAGLGFGNLGNRYASRYIAQVNAAVRPGLGTEISANFAQGFPGLAEDSRGSLYKAGTAAASAVTPWGVFGATYSKATYLIGDKAKPLNPEGDITSFGVNASQLVYADEAGRVSTTETFTRFDNSVTGFAGLIPITDQRYDVASLAASANRSFTAFGVAASITGSLTFSQGLSGRAGSFLPIVPGTPDPRFSMLQGAIAYTQPLPAGFSTGISWTGQWANVTLPQNQQWTLGGVGNLTAWLPGTLVGDLGTLTRASVYFPAWDWRAVQINVSAFAEYGTVHTLATPVGAAASRSLSDVGVAVLGRVAKDTSVTVAYGWPWLAHHVDEQAQGGRAHLYFSVAQTF